MGAWGSGTLDNDGAMDLVSAVVHDDDAAALAAALDAAASVPAEELLGAPEAEEALAAAEIVAAVGGVPAADVPPEVTEWAQTAAVGRAVLTQASTAVARVLADASELRDLWLGDPGSAGEGRDWLRAVDDLASRLRRATPRPGKRRPRRAAEPRRPQVHAGDLLEIPVSDGRLAYAQVVGFNATYWCDILRVLDGLFAERPEDLSALAARAAAFLVHVDLFDDDESPSWPVLRGIAPPVEPDPPAFAFRGGIVFAPGLRNEIEERFG